MKQAIKKFIFDLKSETPKVYRWVCAALVTISAAALTITATYTTMPAEFQQAIPPAVIKGLAVVSLLGAVFAKKQNVTK